MSKYLPEKQTWDDFQAAGLLWWVNRILHLFGWAIVLEYSDEDDCVEDAYPARVSYRGFDEATEEQGFKNLTHHVAENAQKLETDCDGKPRIKDQQREELMDWFLKTRERFKVEIDDDGCIVENEINGGDFVEEVCSLIERINRYE